jgi:hypothetical protein
MPKYQQVKLFKAKMFKWKLGNLSDIKKLGRVIFGKIISKRLFNYLFIIQLLKTQLLQTIWGSNRSNIQF